jgi:hypothetical protein
LITGVSGSAQEAVLKVKPTKKKSDAKNLMVGLWDESPMGRRRIPDGGNNFSQDPSEIDELSVLYPQPDGT